jgi:hypothetical protein
MPAGCEKDAKINGKTKLIVDYPGLVVLQKTVHQEQIQTMTAPHT